MKLSALAIMSGQEEGGGEVEFLRAKKRRVDSPIKLQNRFSPLESTSKGDSDATRTTVGADSAVNSDQTASVCDSERMVTDNDEPVHKPPPLIIDESEWEVEIEKLAMVLDKIVGRKFYKIESRLNKVKIIATEVKYFLIIKKFFAEKNIPYHTRQVKSERAFKVMLKNIHHTFPIASLTEAINAEGHTVRRINKKWNKKGGFWHNMFMVELEPAHNNKDIYTLKHIDQHIITVEPPIKSGEVPQCHNCQQKGHTKNFCYLPPKCVKCGKGHVSTNCSLDKEAPPTCANCNGSHTANYRGCPYLKPTQSANRSVNRFAPNLQREAHYEDAPPPRENPWNRGGDGRSSHSNLEKLIQQQIEMTNQLLTLMTQFINMNSNKCQCHK